MKKLALGTILIAGLLAACGGGDDDGVTVIDAAGGGDGGGIDAPPVQACNPSGAPGMQGCQTGQKCTWITVQETPEVIGKLGCVPDGTAAVGAACTEGPVGETTGYDNCAAGGICITGTCSDICGFDGSAGAACASGFNCTRYNGLFSNGMDEPVAGACNPARDPVTQTATAGGNCGANKGCYLLSSATETIAVCANAGTGTHNMDIAGQAFANSCVPGAQPRRKDAATMTVQCGGLCNPTDVTSTVGMASEGGLEIAGNATAKDNCQTAWAAAPAADGTAGESCRYFWSREQFDGLSPYSNTVGWCFKHAIFQYDSNGDMTNDAPFPRCTTLTTGHDAAHVPPIPAASTNDAQYFWCVALPAMATLGDATRAVKKWNFRHEPKLDRLSR